LAYKSEMIFIGRGQQKTLQILIVKLFY